MKKLCILLIFLAPISLFAQVSLKDITLGEKYTGDLILNSSMAGYEGAIIVTRMDDNRVCMISFVPTTNNYQEYLSVPRAGFKLKTLFESHYGIPNIKLQASGMSGQTLTNIYTGKYVEDEIGISYSIIATRSEKGSANYYYQFNITHIELYKAYLKSDVEIRKADF